MSLSSISAGSVIERVYYTVPTHYSAGEEFDTFIAARDHAVTRWLEANERHPQLMVSNEIYVDLRWSVVDVSGRSIDSVVERIKMPALRIVKVVSTFGLHEGDSAARSAREQGLRCVWNTEEGVFEVAQTASPFPAFA